MLTRLVLLGTLCLACVGPRGRAAEDLFLTAWQFTEPDLERVNAGLQ